MAMSLFILFDFGLHQGPGPRKPQNRARIAENWTEATQSMVSVIDLKIHGTIRLVEDDQ